MQSKRLKTAESKLLHQFVKTRLNITYIIIALYNYTHNLVEEQ